MIGYHRYVLENGLAVILHEDMQTPVAAVNVLYRVGSRDDDPGKTGFAHLFEHLMFSGSANVPDYDAVMQRAGGESNATTNRDYTHFFTTLPAKNVETALWVESDRMLALQVKEPVLEVQKKVVVEEFYETCLNVPYGDVWHELSALCYERHPYRWPTIGLHPDHIRSVSLRDVGRFQQNYYHPANAVLVLAGPFSVRKMKDWVSKWFNDIPPGPSLSRVYPQEPIREQAKHRQSPATVPVDAIYLAFPCPGRGDSRFHAVDLLTDIFANGPSSRLVDRHTRTHKHFHAIDCYVSGDFDPGMIVFEGRPAEGISLEQAEEILLGEIDQLQAKPLDIFELQTWKHKAESALILSEVGIASKSMNLGNFEVLGDLSMINAEAEIYRTITPEAIQDAARTWLKEGQRAVVTYAGKPEISVHPARKRRKKSPPTSHPGPLHADPVL